MYSFVYTYVYTVTVTFIQLKDNRYLIFYFVKFTGSSCGSVPYRFIDYRVGIYVAPHTLIYFPLG